MDRSMDGGMDGWVGGWMDGYTASQPASRADRQTRPDPIGPDRTGPDQTGPIDRQTTTRFVWNCRYYDGVPTLPASKLKVQSYQSCCVWLIMGLNITGLKLRALTITLGIAQVPCKRLESMCRLPSPSYLLRLLMGNMTPISLPPTATPRELKAIKPENIRINLEFRSLPLASRLLDGVRHWSQGPRNDKPTIPNKLQGPKP